MKIRTGFVSNSSSSSFCIAKAYMTEDEIKKCSEFCLEHKEQSWMSEQKLYFVGMIYFDEDELMPFIRKTGISQEMIAEVE